MLPSYLLHSWSTKIVLQDILTSLESGKIKNLILFLKNCE